MNPFDALLVLSLLALGAVLLTSAFGSLGPARRVRRIPTRAVSALTEGLSEVAGTIRAVAGASGDESLRTLDGTNAVVVRTSMSSTQRRGNKTYRVLAGTDDLETVPVELTDATGTCVLELDEMIVLGETQRWQFTRDELESAHPTLFAKLVERNPPSGTIVQVYVEQTWIADGATALVSGEATASEIDSEDYRGRHRRFRMQSSAFDPLIVSSWPEGALQKHLVGPAVRLGWIGALCFAAAGAILLCARLVTAAAGQ